MTLCNSVIENTITVSSTDSEDQNSLIKKIRFGNTISMKNAYFDFDCLNTIYNVPVNTAIDFNGTSVDIAAGYYTPANISSQLQSLFDLIVPGTIVSIDPNTRKITVSGPGTFTMDLSMTSKHLATILGFNRTSYSGSSSYTGTKVSQSGIGTGIYVTLGLIQFAGNYSVVSSSLLMYTIYIPWSGFGERMTNTTNDIVPKIYRMNKAYSFEAITVEIRDTYGTQINLNGSDFLLRINNIND